MISIKHNSNTIEITGHSIPEVCAAVSCIMYTCVNVLIESDKNCIGFNDSGDKVVISFKKNTKLTKIVKRVFMNEINDLIEELYECNKSDCLSVEYIK